MAKRRPDDDDADEPKGTPSDAYVGLLAICLVAMLTAGVLLFLDFSAQDEGTPKPADPSIKLADTGLNKPKAPGGGN